VLPITVHISDVREYLNQNGESVLENHSNINANVAHVKKLLNLESMLMKV
jgi:hypothetical protein